MLLNYISLVTGLTEGEFITQARSLVNPFLGSGAKISAYIKVYARSGYLKEALNLIFESQLYDQKILIKLLLKQLSDYNHLPNSEEYTLALLCSTHNLDLRNEFIDTLHELNPKIQKTRLLKKVSKIQNIKDKYNLNFSFAKAWLEENIHMWFLQGIQLVINKKIPLDIFIYLSTYITQLSFVATEKLFKLHRIFLPLKLYNDCLIDLNEETQETPRFFSLFKSTAVISPTQTQYETLKNAAFERY